MDYKEAGVDVEAGRSFITQIKKDVESTKRPGVLGGLGGFGGCFEMPTGYKQPVLVSGTDGVGTKLKIAQELNRHDTVGIDLVAMCVNDILTSGAEPLFFLDYLATGKLNSEQLAGVVKGIAEGCRQSGCALLGGETAEMPGFYQLGEYDLAGCCVGVVEKSQLMDGSKVEVGDVAIGLASAGVHSNGFSLVRKIIETGNHSWSDTPDMLNGNSLGEELITHKNSSEELSQALFDAPFVVVSHGIQADPIFNYGNQTALQLWSISWDKLIQTPSRLSAEPVNRATRLTMLEQAATKGYIDNYQGVRVATTGERFSIKQAIIWNLTDKSGQRCGQAATFSNWQWL